MHPSQSLFSSSPVRRAAMATVTLLFLASFIIGWRARWDASVKAAEISELRAKLTRAHADQARWMSKHDDLLREGQIAVAAEVRSFAGDEVYENALSAWISRVKQLEAFRAAHPEFEIGELSLINEFDWLDATKQASFESVADLRKALSELRRIARRKSAPAIGRALADAVAANGGMLPGSIEELARFLPSDLDPSILGRFTLNPTGQVDGLVNTSGPSTFFSWRIRSTSCGIPRASSN